MGQFREEGFRACDGHVQHASRLLSVRILRIVDAYYAAHNPRIPALRLQRHQFQPQAKAEVNPLPRCALNWARSPGATRIAFSTRMCGSSPRAQSWYTVSRHTFRKAATSRIVNRRSVADTRVGYFLHPHSPECVTPPFGSRDAG